MKSDLKKPRIVKFWANLIHFVDKANILVMFVLLSQNKTFFSIITLDGVPVPERSKQQDVKWLFEIFI